jgi:hypothetical protein
MEISPPKKWLYMENAETSGNLYKYPYFDTLETLFLIKVSITLNSGLIEIYISLKGDINKSSNLL